MKSSNAGPPTPKPPGLLDQVRAKLRLQHASIRTEEAYIQWITRFILFHKKRHPREMGPAEIEAFLTHLAIERQVSASTQNQAFSALLYLYQQVLNIELPRLDALRARRLSDIVDNDRSQVCRRLSKSVRHGGDPAELSGASSSQ